MSEKYLHISVLVAKDASGRLMRTPPGKGATAKRLMEKPKRVGKARREWLRQERANGNLA